MLRKKTSLLFILIPVLADAMGYGLLLPVMPALISGLVGGDVVRAAVYGGWLLTTFAVMQLLFAPVIGNLSDRFGRKLFLILSLFPLVLDSTLLAFTPSIVWLFAGKIAGGTVAGSYSLASAYVADVTNEEQRSKYYGLLNAAVGSGMIVGTVMGGILSVYGVRIPCLVAALLGLAAILMASFLLPESLSEYRRRAWQWHQINPVQMFGSLRKIRFLRGLIVVMALVSMGMETIESMWSYFTVERFDWTGQTVGYSLGLMGLLFALVQGVVCPFLLPKLGDKRAIFTGLFIQCFAFIGIALASRGWMLFALVLPYAAGTIYGPALQALMARQVPPDRQGELQGGLSAVRNLISILNPLIMAGLFQLFTKPECYFPGMPFMVVAVFLLIALVLVKKSFSQGSDTESAE